MHVLQVMCYKAPMKAILALTLALLPLPALACDWVAERKVDPMTDVATCSVRSPTAKVAFYRRGNNRPNVVAASAYRQYGLTIRIDNNAPIRMGDNSGARQTALDQLLPQLATGQRIRTQYRDYPANQDGDAPICNLPALLESCEAQATAN